MTAGARQASRLLAFLAVCILTASVACSDPPPSKYPTQPPEVELSTLGRDDVFVVRVFYGAKEIEREYTVGGSGEINFPFIGRVIVEGRTQADVESDIQTRLADGFLRDPVVSILVKERRSQRIAVLGQVENPGTQSYFPGMSVTQAISQAGGFTPLAKKNAVTVTRTEGGTPTKYTVPVQSITENRAENFPMKPGDEIFVPERSW